MWFESFAMKSIIQLCFAGFCFENLWMKENQEGIIKLVELSKKVSLYSHIFLFNTYQKMKCKMAKKTYRK